MWRYLFARLAIGLVVGLLVLAFYEGGLFPWLAAHLHLFYDRFPASRLAADAAPLRLLQYPVVVVAAFGAAWVAAELDRGGRRFIVAAAASLVIILASPVLALYGVLFEPVSGLVAVVLASAAVSVYSRGEAARRKRLFRERFAGRVSEGVLAELAVAPFQVRLGGETRPVSVLVCRVLNGTELRENLRAREAVEALNHFITSSADFLREAGAYLDETGPDSVRVLVGVPLADEDHAAAACRIALGLRAKLRELELECEGRWRARPSWGIGVAAGEMTVGFYGEGGATRIGALGPESDLARRLAGANRDYGSSVLVSSSGFALAGESMLFRPMDMLQDAEAGAVVEIYELVAEAGGLDDGADARREAFWRGVVRLRSGDFEAALEEFGVARPPDADDPPIEYYIARAKEGMAAGGDQAGPGRGKRGSRKAAKL